MEAFFCECDEIQDGWTSSWFNNNYLIKRKTLWMSVWTDNVSQIPVEFHELN